MTEFNYKDSEHLGMQVGKYLAIISILCAFIPSLFEWDMMRTGYGFTTICGFFFIMGMVTYFMYRSRCRQLEEILEGKNVLAHWSYDAKDYLESVEEKYKENKATNFMLFKIVSFFFVLFTSLFLIFGFSSSDSDQISLFLLIMGGSLFAISIAAYISPIVQRNHSLRAFPEVIIAHKGMLYQGKLHTWGSPLFILQDVSVNKKSTRISFRIKYFTRIGWYKYETYRVDIAIPQGKEKEAEKVVSALQS